MTTLSLTDGTTTVSLSSSGVGLSEYTPTAAQRNELGELENVTETAELFLTSTQSANADTVRGVRKLLETAKRRARTGAGPQVYVQVQFANDAAAWRSEVVNGKVEFGEDGAAMWDRNVTPMLLHFERRGFWEGARSQLSIYSLSDATPRTSAVRVYNNGTNGNYFHIGADQVAGDLETPLEWKAVSGAGVTIPRLVASNHVDALPLTFNPVLAGSAKSWVATPAPYYSQTWVWALTAAQLQACAGQMIRLVLAFSTAPASGVMLRPVVHSTDGSIFLPLTYGEWTPSKGLPILELPALAVPPGGYEAATGNIGIGVDVLSIASGSATLGMGLLMPAELGKYRQMEMVGAAGLSTGDAIIDDGITQKLYVLTAGGVKWPFWAGRNAPLMVRPAVENRVRLVWGADGAYNSAQYYDVFAWYRPRRSLI